MDNFPNCPPPESFIQKIELTITELGGDKIKLSYQVLNPQKQGEKPCCPPYCKEIYTLDEKRGFYIAPDESDAPIKAIKRA